MGKCLLKLNVLYIRLNSKSPNSLVHFLLCFREKLRPNQIYNITRAEKPDADNDKQLFHSVILNTVHEPCDPYNPLSPCMKDAHSTIKFLRALFKKIHHNDKGYPLYGRRAPENGGRTATIKERSLLVIVTRDNSRIVAYSPILVKIFDAHVSI